MSTPPENKSYLSGGLSAFSPWPSRSATPSSGQAKEEEEDPKLGKQRGGDHTVNSRHRISLKSYPRDTPPLNVQWYHAVDVPKRKPRFQTEKPPKKESEDPPKPKKWLAFSQGDSRAIESRYQKLAEDEEARDRGRLADISDTLKEGSAKSAASNKVSVNEDFLFDVDIDNRELAPAYWLGPIYEVRRGFWFMANGTPCEENLATQLEEGYLKLKPWRFAKEQGPRPKSQTRSRPTSIRADEKTAKALRELSAQNLTPKSSSEELRPRPSPASADRKGRDRSQSPVDPAPMRAHRLFGDYMNSVVTYEDASTAWLLTDTFLSQMSSTVYQRFAGGGHFAGVKYTRGFTEKTKAAKDKKPVGSAGSTSENEASDVEDSGRDEVHDEDENPQATSPSDIRRRTLERQISSLAAEKDPDKQEAELRKREEKEIRDDYKDQGDDQGRPIEHLLLITHGIGQRLGLRMESINFVHDVNTLRKTMKSVYADSPDLQALNGEIESLAKNSRIQVLPICWRHLLDFPRQSLKQNRKEYDMGGGEADFDDAEYPKLEDITVEGVPAVRNLLTDLALDILLYQSPTYKIHISRIVLEECNRIHRLFKQRNPGFNGKVSLVGHSLGSAIMFDLLCKQHERNSNLGAHHQHHSRNTGNRKEAEESFQFDFDVDSFYALGSPLGLFQMLRGRTVAARQKSFKPATTPGDPMDDPFLSSAGVTGTTETFDTVVSSPRCQAIYNIFHPTDPVAYRIEPLISPAMSSLKAQPLPYTKKGIFGAPAVAGLSGIGQRVGASVSGFLSSFGTGIASRYLIGGLGASTDSGTGNSSGKQLSRAPPSVTAAAHSRSRSGSAATSVPASADALVKEEKQRRLTVGTGEVGEHPPTLIDSEIETLYSGFQKRPKSQKQEEKEMDEEHTRWAEEEHSRKLRREEAKVRALNSNGRVDYSIQEGAFDISLLASIASHLAYWADEDVSHFALSQLLSRQRVVKQINQNYTVKEEDDIGMQRKR